MKDLINLAAKVVGSQSKLAEALAVTQQNISYWKGAGIPIEYGAEIERVTNGVVTRKALWPQTWQKYWPELAQVPADGAEPATEQIAEVEPAPLRVGFVRRQGGRREVLQGRG
ncbi:MAG: helix-turn-helix domain-containing protein [Candidatus Saccharibacteria bacterium]|nr:helix-turn-helix domain-containing protein [Rhodoferax sp.]